MLRDVTIIVPTCNEAHNISAFLGSIPHGLKLVVVDDSDDDTPQRVARQRPQATQIIQAATTVTQARQLGAAAASTTWLLFTDADVVFAGDYFEYLARYLALGYGALYGAKLSLTGYETYYRWFVRGQKFAEACGIPAVSGSNLIVRRDVFAAVGGFDLTLTCNEDSEIGWRIKRHGYGIRFVPRLIVYANDHRRLIRQGPVGKTVHSLVRCSLLWSRLMPSAWRRHDWGYWSSRKSERAQAVQRFWESGSI